MAGDGNAIRRRAQRRGDLLDHLAGALIRFLRAFRKHRAAVLIDDLDIEAFLGLLDHDVLGGFGELRHVLQGLAQRRRGERKGAVLLEPPAMSFLAVVLVRLRRRGGLFGRNVLRPA